MLNLSGLLHWRLSIMWDPPKEIVGCVWTVFISIFMITRDLQWDISTQKSILTQFWFSIFLFHTPGNVVLFVCFFCILDENYIHWKYDQKTHVSVHTCVCVCVLYLSEYMRHCVHEWRPEEHGTACLPQLVLSPWDRALTEPGMHYFLG